MAVLYTHIKPNGEVFYIGIGKTIKRANSKHNRSNYWKNVVAAYGYEVQILKQDLSWEEACELEKILISHYGRRDLKLGTLVNLTDGGEGSLGVKMSSKTLRLKSEIMKGKMSGCKNPMFGKKGKDHPVFGYRVPQESKDKRKANYIKENHHFYNKKFSQSHKDKIGKASIGRIKSEETIEKIKINHASKKTGYIPPTLGKSLPKRIILDNSTGIFYNTVKEASAIYNIKISTLTAMLNGRNTNKTTLTYC